jgi:hypothetical protein
LVPRKISLQARSKLVAVCAKASFKKIKKQIRESGKIIRELKELMDIKKSLINKKLHRTGPYKII